MSLALGLAGLTHLAGHGEARAQGRPGAAPSAETARPSAAGAPQPFAADDVEAPGSEPDSAPGEAAAARPPVKRAAGEEEVVVPVEALPPTPPPRPEGPRPGVTSRRAGDAGEEIVIDISRYVTVTATKERQTIGQSPSIITVVTRDQILTHGYRSVAEALRSVPGLFVSYDYVLFDAGVRGISGELRGGSRLIKFMINGNPVSFRSESTNFIGPEMIPMAAVERIEVILGPGSALYGANAFLGVVNIITRTGKDAARSEVHVGGTLFKDRYAGVDLGALIAHQVGPLDVMFALTASHENRNGLSIACTTHIDGEAPCSNLTSVTESLLGRRSAGDIAEPLSLVSTVDLDLARLVASKRELGHFNVLANFQRLDSAASFADWATLLYQVEGGDDPHSANRVSLGNLLVRARYEIPLWNELFTFKLEGAYAKGWVTAHDRLKQPSGYTSRAGVGSESMDVAGEIRFSPIVAPTSAGVNKLNLLVGGDYTLDDVSFVENPATVPLGYGSALLRSAGVFGQLHGSLWRQRIGLTAGLRYDLHRGGRVAEARYRALPAADQDNLCGGPDDAQVCYSRLSYRAGATFLLLDNLVELGETARGERGFLIDELYIKLLYGTAFKAPAPAFLYGVGYLGARPLNTNPGLSPQTVGSLEAQIGANLWRKRVFLSATFFDQRLQNRAEFNRETQAVNAINGADIHSLGVVGEVRFDYRPVSIYSNIAYVHSERDLGDNPDDRIPETFGYPDLTSTAGISCNIPLLHLVTTFETQYIGRRVGHPFNRSDRQGEKYELPPYALLNLYLATRQLQFWTDTETQLVFRVENLLDTRYAFPGFQPYYRYDVPGLPRTFMLSLTQSF